MSAAWPVPPEISAADDDSYVSWQRRGLCQQHPADLFFPEEEKRKGVRRKREDQAKRICLECPVLATCRDHALRTPEKYGIWGAMTTRERLSITVRAS